MFKSHIKLMVMKRLDKEISSGYDLIKYFDEYGEKTSPGYIYPLLNNLQKNNFIKIKKEGRRNLCSITKKGKKLLETLENSRKEMIKVISSISDGQEAREFIKIRCGKINSCSKKEKEIIKKMHILIHMLHVNRNNDKTNTIIENAIKKLKQL